jgi:hypothetical protein
MPMRSTPLVAAALAVAACATSTTSRTVREDAGEVALVDARAPLVVRVSSRYAAPLAIYAVTNGVATRLGEVPGGRAEQFQLAATQIPAGGLTLLAVPVAGDARATSGVLRVVPGSVIDFAVGAALGDARATVRSP